MLVAFCIATVGFVVVQPLFWTLPTAYLSGTAAASGIAMIGALGNLGGFIAPTLKTALETLFHSQRAGMFSLAFAGVIGVLLDGALTRGVQLLSAAKLRICWRLGGTYSNGLFVARSGPGRRRTRPAVPGTQRDCRLARSAGPASPTDE